MTNQKALEVLKSWLRVAYQNADGTDEDSAELYEALQTVFALITHQQAEIERLREENNRLAEDWSNLTVEKDQLFDEAKSLISRAKTEAYREFAERLKEKADRGFWQEHSYVDVEDINNLVKEMVSENSI